MVKKFALIILSGILMGQSAKYYLHKGNKSYKEGKYLESIENYSKANLIDKNPISDYNTGNAFYKMDSLNLALRYWGAANALAKSKIDSSRIFYNIGNGYLAQQKYKEAIEAYKSALLLNPADSDARYNLVYALLKMQNQPQPPPSSSNQQQNEQRDNQQKNAEKSENKNKSEDRKSPKSSQPQESKNQNREYQNILKALEQKEKQLQESIRQRQLQEGKRYVPEKDW